MKPTKNRIFCVDARRPKMLFKSEAAATRFIKFNTEDILNNSNKTPIRAYFCVACGGYHVTSKEDVPELKSRVEQYFDNKIENINITQQIEDISKQLAEVLYFHYHRKETGIASSIYKDITNKLLILNQQYLKQCTHISALAHRVEQCLLNPDISINDIFIDINKSHRLYSDMKHIIKLRNSLISKENL